MSGGRRQRCTRNQVRPTPPTASRAVRPTLRAVGVMARSDSCGRGEWTWWAAILVLDHGPAAPGSDRPVIAEGAGLLGGEVGEEVVQLLPPAGLLNLEG